MLLARLKAGKHSCENLLSMFVARAEMEEEYAKKMTNKDALLNVLTCGIVK